MKNTYNKHIPRYIRVIRLPQQGFGPRVPNYSPVIIEFISGLPVDGVPLGSDFSFLNDQNWVKLINFYSHFYRVRQVVSLPNYTFSFDVIPSGQPNALLKKLIRI